MKSNNFTQALKELTGFDTPEDAVKKEKPVQSESAHKVSAAPSFSTPEVSETISSDAFISKKIVDMSDAEITHITSTMVIEGEIKSEDNLLIEGQVYGDIATTANLTSTSLIVGSVKAQNAALTDSRHKGDIHLDGHLDVSQNTIIVGDITCESIKASGKIKGNLDIAGSVILRDNALISGNILADDIASAPGTRINGTISSRSDTHDLDAEFDFGGDF